jgi:hypothetical protein
MKVYEVRLEQWRKDRAFATTSVQNFKARTAGEALRRAHAWAKKRPDIFVSSRAIEVSSCREVVSELL